MMFWPIDSEHCHTPSIYYLMSRNQLFFKAVWQPVVLTSSDLMSTSVKYEDLAASGKTVLLRHTGQTAYLMSEASVTFL